MEERNQDVRFLQSGNTSEKLLWFAARRICAHIKRPIKGSVNFGLLVLHAPSKQQ